MFGGFKAIMCWVELEFNAVLNIIEQTRVELNNVCLSHSILSKGTEVQFCFLFFLDKAIRYCFAIITAIVEKPLQDNRQRNELL